MDIYNNNVPEIVHALFINTRDKFEGKILERVSAFITKLQLVKMNANGRKPFQPSEVV